MKKLFQLLVITVLFSGCARTYHAIRPEIYNYDNKKFVTEELNVSYFYDVQNHSRNKRYARKERKQDFKLMAIKVENNSDSILILTRDNFYIKTASGRDIKIVAPEMYTKLVRQYSETFVLFYGIAGIGYTWGEENGEKFSKVTYSPLPLIIGVGNAIYAGISNSNQKKNLIEKDIFNKPIYPKSSIYGLIAISESGFPELNFFYYK